VERKKAEKTAVLNVVCVNTFQALALEFLEIHREGKKDSYIRSTLGRAQKHLFPFIGSRPIAEIEPPELLSVLRQIENSGFINTTSKMKIFCGQVFRYAIATGRATRDITSDLRGAFKSSASRHFF
jgi:hypothetical protein